MQVILLIAIGLVLLGGLITAIILMNQPKNKQCVPNCLNKKCTDSDGCGGKCSCITGLICKPDGTCCAPQCPENSCSDDGCGGTCGTCKDPAKCFRGFCCTSKCDGKECGDDGCGGFCGTGPPSAQGCTNDHTVCTSGKCECVKQCDGKQCGDDSCGGTCGTCPENSKCDNGKCVCVPNCVGKTCGTDGCGGTCGTGAGPSGCLNSNYKCENGNCVCIPDCGGKVCGPNGCGGDCGTCPAGQLCSDNHTKCVCTPKCTPGTCGSDGCGGTCGCPNGQTCGTDKTCCPLLPSCNTSNGCGCKPGDVCYNTQCCTPKNSGDCRDNYCGDLGCGLKTCDCSALGSNYKCVGTKCVVDTCSPHGAVQLDGSCVCNSGWVGTHCSYSNNTTCHSHGTVDANGNCSCTDGWRTASGSSNTCNDCQFGPIPVCSLAVCGATMFETVLNAQSGITTCNQNRASSVCNSKCSSFTKSNIIVVSVNRGCVAFLGGNTPALAPLTANPPQYNVSDGTVIGTNCVLKWINGTTNQCFITQASQTIPADNSSALWNDTYWGINLTTNQFQKLQNEADFYNPLISSIFYVVDMSKFSQFANANSRDYMSPSVASSVSLDPFAVIAPSSAHTFSAWFASDNGLVAQVNPPSGYVKLSDYIGSTSVAIPQVFLFAKYASVDPGKFSWWVKECDGVKVVFDSNPGDCPIFGSPYPHFRIAQPTCSDENYVAIGMYLGLGSNFSSGSCGGVDCGSYAGFKAAQGGVGIYAIHRSLLIAVASKISEANLTYKTSGGCTPSLGAVISSAYNTFFPAVSTYGGVTVPPVPFYQIVPFLSSSQSLA